MQQKPKNNFLVTEIGTDELLKLLDLNSEELVNLPEFQDNQLSASNSPIISFIQAFDIKYGEYTVSCDILYELFKQWNKHTLIDKRNFNLQFSKYIPCIPNLQKKFYFFTANYFQKLLFKHFSL